MSADGWSLVVLALAAVVVAKAARGGSRGVVRAGSSGPKPKPDFEVIGTTGDLHSFSHGGGVVFKDHLNARGGEPDVEWWFWESPNPYDHDFDEDTATYKVSKISVAADVIADHSWVDVASVASSVGTDEKALRRLAKSRDPLDRARVLEDFVGNYGAYDFDQYPTDYTKAELVALFPSLK